VIAPSESTRVGTLYVIPSLLGVVEPAAVLPRRTIDVTRALAHFVVETPRIARQFLKSLAPTRPLQAIAMSELDEHTPEDRVPQYLIPALRGHDLGLLTDAGAPGVADPGTSLVRAAHAGGVSVVPLVGPSAVLLALMASGLNGQAFAFHGYLPVKAAPRDATLRGLDRAAGAGPTQLFIEAPYRNDALIAAVLATCRKELRFCVAADLTLPTERIVCRTIGEWRAAAPMSFAKRPAMFLLGV
jgi:16S rRNA (cytidine1402-2'-O)-methyltransferase